ncbi:hypothetical protein ILUMI_00906, partial [Ignelater luminosus]
MEKSLLLKQRINEIRGMLHCFHGGFAMQHTVLASDFKDICKCLFLYGESKSNTDFIFFRRWHLLSCDLSRGLISFGHTKTFGECGANGTGTGGLLDDVDGSALDDDVRRDIGAIGISGRVYKVKDTGQCGASHFPGECEESSSSVRPKGGSSKDDERWSVPPSEKQYGLQIVQEIALQSVYTETLTYFHLC